MCEHAVMVCLAMAMQLRWARRLALGAALAVHAHVALSAPCAPPEQGRGRVAGMIDGSSFRLGDGREVRLAGIEPLAATKAERVTALATILSGQEVVLRGNDDAPDRYGRQIAFVDLAADSSLVQAQLVSAGQALVLPDIGETDCAAALMAAEAEASRAKRGTWAGNNVIKNAESPDDILASVGRFSVVEGGVLSVRQAGPTTYLNFGRNWTRDFAVTISRRAVPAFATAGIALKSLEGRRIRVRGWIEARPGPRIEASGPAQIEVGSGN